MNTELVCIWLKSSIPGIVLLGAIGSIVAYLFLKLCAWLVRRYMKGIIIKVVTPLLRNMLTAKLVADHLDGKYPNKAIAHFTYIVVFLCASTVMVFSFLSLIILYFIIRGPVLGLGIFILIIIDFLVFYAWLSDFSAFSGAYQIYLRHDTDQFNNHKINDLIRLVEQVDERRKQEELLKKQSCNPHRGKLSE